MREQLPTVIRPECGTTGGYNRHAKRREKPCRPCLDANRAYRRKWRAENVPPKSERTEPTRRPGCGTPPGYSAHHRAGEHACDDCKQAMTDKQVEHYHHGGGAEVQRRRRQTATSLRVNREAKQRERDRAKIDRLTRWSWPRRWQRLGRRDRT